MPTGKPDFVWPAGATAAGQPARVAGEVQSRERNGVFLQRSYSRDFDPEVARTLSVAKTFLTMMGRPRSLPPDFFFASTSSACLARAMASGRRGNPPGSRNE